MRIRLAALATFVVALVTTLALAATAGAIGGAKRVTSLNGAEECNATTCSQGDPDGSGSAAITLNVGHASVCWDITVADITLPATASHIHLAPAGTPGSVVIPLSPPDASGHSSGCTTAAPALIQNIIDHPEEYYVNVHNTDFPAGAVRGQLSSRGQAD